MNIRKLLSRENRKYIIRVIWLAIMLFIMITVGGVGLGAIINDSQENCNWCKALWIVAFVCWIFSCVLISGGAYIFWFGNLDYTKEHLRKAFKAGEDLTYWQVNGWPGDDPGFNDFEEWFSQKNGKVSGLKAKKQNDDKDNG